MVTVDDLAREMDVPVVMADEQGGITYVNTRFEADFAWKKEDLLGRSLTTLIPARLHDAHNLGFSRYLLTGIPALLGVRLDLEIVTGKGEVKRVEHFIISESKEGKRMFAARLRTRD